MWQGSLDQLHRNQKQLPEVFCKKRYSYDFSKFTGKHLCQYLFDKVAGLRPVTLAQVFSCEFWEISQNTFFTEHVWAAASKKFWYRHDCKLTKEYAWKFATISQQSRRKLFFDIWRTFIKIVQKESSIFSLKNVQPYAPEADLGLLQHPRWSTLW